MLTRSFVKSYLLLNDKQNITVLEDGLKTINKEKYIKTTEPTEREKIDIKSKLVIFSQTPQMSYEDFINSIFIELEINNTETIQKIKEALSSSSIERFDKDQTIKFITNVKDFY